LVDSERLRLRQFHERVAGLIPCDPEGARVDLHTMGLTKLLSHYVNWADRYVAPRPRRVVTWDGFLRHGSTRPDWDAVRALAAKIEAGNDLKPYLSDKIDRYGYVRPKVQGKDRPRGVEWGDKDYALNAYETHHLHLNRSGTGLLYVNFSRYDAFLVMVGDHKSFDDGTLAQAVAEARVGTSHELQGILGPLRPRTMDEHNRLQRRGFTTAFSVGGHTVLGAMLSRTGTSPLHTMHADRMIFLIEELDPQIDEPGFGRQWFERNGKAYPATPNFEWMMRSCDLCLIETTTAFGIPMVEWKR
jgi:hypothetical protein